MVIERRSHKHPDRQANRNLEIGDKGSGDEWNLQTSLFTQQMQSHDHGYGKFKRTLWGSVEECRQCQEEAKRMTELRKWWEEKRRVNPDAEMILNDGSRLVMERGIITDVEEAI